MTGLSRAVEALKIDDGQSTSTSDLVPTHEPTTRPRLTSLPPELLCNVISYVDPKTLIDLAQTCHSLRSFIKPSRHDFLDRLLCLELDMEEEASREASAPDSPDVAHLVKMGIGRAPYACSGCIKLLHHMRFDNHSLLKLKWRKPPAGSHEATKLTGWMYTDENDERGARIKIHRRRQAEKRKLVEWENAYKRGVREGDAGLQQVAESHLVGRSRTTRLCNHCKFQRGYFTRSNLANRSLNPDLVVIVSRQLPFRTSIDRYFPGLFPDLPISDYPRLFKIMKQGTMDYKSLFTSKCSTCQKWKEVADYLQLHEHVDYHLGPREPTTVNRVECNRCLVNQSPQTIFQTASTLALECAQKDLRQCQYTFYFGWRILESNLRSPMRKPWHLLGKLKNRLLANLPWEVTKEYGGNQKMLLVDQCDLDHLRDRVRLLREACDKLSAEGRREVLENEWFKTWVEDYERLEKAWVMAKVRLEAIKDDGFEKKVSKYYRSRWRWASEQDWSTG